MTLQLTKHNEMDNPKRGKNGECKIRVAPNRNKTNDQTELSIH